MPRLLSWGSPPSKSFISSLHLTFRQKPRGKRRSRQKVCPRGHSSSISFCRAGARRHSPAPPAAPSDARRSAPPSVLHKGLGWSRLSARSALQSVSRFEVSTGDPRPLATLARLSLPTLQREQSAFSRQSPPQSLKIPYCQSDRLPKM